MISPPSPIIRKTYKSWCLLWSIYVRSQNINIRHNGIDLVYIEYYSGYELALNWWTKMAWNCCCHSTDDQSTSIRKFTHPDASFDQNIFFSEYRDSPWLHWSRVHRIHYWIEIGLELLEKDGLEFPLQQHLSLGIFVATALMISHSTSIRKFTHPDD